MAGLAEHPWQPVRRDPCRRYRADDVQECGWPLPPRRLGLVRHKRRRGSASEWPGAADFVLQQVPAEDGDHCRRLRPAAHPLKVSSERLLALPLFEDAHPARIDRVGAEGVLDAAGLPQSGKDRLTPAGQELVPLPGLHIDGSCDNEHLSSLTSSCRPGCRAEPYTAAIRGGDPPI